MLSKRASIWEDGWWRVVMMVRPSSASARSSRTTVRAVAESRPLVGSSSSSVDGSVSSSFAMFTRFRSPPETPLTTTPSPMRVSAHPSRRSWASTPATRASRSARLAPRIRRRAVKRSVSATVRRGEKMSACMQ